MIGLEHLGLFVLGWGIALSTLGFVGIAKWIWHIVATSTEESVVEQKSLEELKK